jgi:hypothetical protein
MRFSSSPGLTRAIGEHMKPRRFAMAEGEKTVAEEPANWQLYVYWIDEGNLTWARDALARLGLRIKASKMTPCQTMKASSDTVLMASPTVFNGLCGRQGSWYRGSHRSGETLLVSATRLAGGFETFLDAVVRETDFVPGRLPGDEEIAALTEMSEYQTRKPPDWELIGLKDAVLQKLLFTLTGFWKRGDSLKKHWPKQCASHANFLARQFTTELDGEAVPYSVSNSVSVCSSCVETFNLVTQSERKLVAPCPGAVRFGGAKVDVYLDVQPVKRWTGSCPGGSDK